MRPALSPRWACTLFFIRQNRSRRSGSCRIPIGGGPTTTVLEVPQDIRAHHVSPDGVSHRRGDYPNHRRMHRSNIVASADRRRPTRGPSHDERHQSASSVVPVRKCIAPTEYRRRVSPISSGSIIGGGPPRQLTRFTRGTIDLYPAISPDGRRIAYHRGTQESNIVLLKPRATE